MAYREIGTETLEWDPMVGPWDTTLGWNIYTLRWYDISVYIKDTHSTTSSISLFLQIEFLPLPIMKNFCWARDRTFLSQYYLDGSKCPIWKLGTLFYLKLMDMDIGRFRILELRNRVTNWVTRLIVMCDLIFISEFANFRAKNECNN